MLHFHFSTVENSNNETNDDGTGQKKELPKLVYFWLESMVTPGSVPCVFAFLVRMSSANQHVGRGINIPECPTAGLPATGQNGGGSENSKRDRKKLLQNVPLTKSDPIQIIIFQLFITVLSAVDCGTSQRGRFTATRTAIVAWFHNQAILCVGIYWQRGTRGFMYC